MTAVVRTDILASLQAMHGDVQRRAAELDRFRALKAIEQTIADFPDLDEITRSLGDIRDRVQQQLDGTREFRALRTIERILPELSDVLGLLDQGAEGERDPEVSDGPAKDGLANDGSSADNCIALSSAQSASEAAYPRKIETLTFVDALETPDLPASAAYAETAFAETALVEAALVETAPAEAAHAEHSAATTSSDGAGRALPEERSPQRSEASGPWSETAHVPSLADSVAQLMAQAVAPPPRDHSSPPMPPDWNADIDAAAPPQSPAERAA